MSSARWWVTLVTFELTGAPQNILPETYQGAVGWMAGLARDEADLRQVIANSLAAEGLRLLSLTDERPLTAGEDLTELDEHLAANFDAREPGKVSVWGTLHVYVGDGEA